MGLVIQHKVGGLVEDGFGDQRNVSVVGCGGSSTSRVLVAGNLCCGSILHRYVFKDILQLSRKESRILHLKFGVLL